MSRSLNVTSRLCRGPWVCCSYLIPYSVTQSSSYIVGLNGNIGGMLEYLVSTSYTIFPLNTNTLFSVAGERPLKRDSCAKSQEEHFSENAQWWQRRVSIWFCFEGLMVFSWLRHRYQGPYTHENAQQVINSIPSKPMWLMENARYIPELQSFRVSRRRTLYYGWFWPCMDSEFPC